MLPPSTRLGPYEIESPLGAGGMGEVYRARDTRLGRDVAIKVLPAHFAGDPDREARFAREARLVAALSHPNILAIHDVGTEGRIAYAVMELLDGETLRDRLGRGRLPVRKAVDIGAAVAEGLAAAHAVGIVHRDLKPENIFLTRDGRVKVLDFGLARMAAPPAAATGTDLQAAGATGAGTIIGTPAYMAPEQVRGEPVDARGDIFALGCVLAEMVTGRPVFARQTAADTLAAILHGDPPRLSDAPGGVPRALGRVIARCLEKEPADRYQSTSDLPFALLGALDAPAADRPAAARRVPRAARAAAALTFLVLAAVILFRLASGGAARGPIRSVAVLPFENVGGDPASEYLSDGLADHIINGLTNVRGQELRVRPLASVARYRSRPVETAAAARELNVDALVLGTLRQQQDTLIISVALVDAREDVQLWGQRYHGTLDDILALQDRFAADVAANLRLRLTRAEQRALARRDTEDPQAYLLYRQGLHEFNRFSPDGLHAARDLFQRALQRDPDYVSALVGVGRTYILLGSMHLGPKATHAEAQRVIARARALDPDHPEVRVQQGVLHLFHDWDWDAARRALEPTGGAFTPGLLFTELPLYGFYLAAVGRAEAALAAIEQGAGTDPLAAPRRAEVAQAAIWTRDYPRAIGEARRTLDLDPQFMLAFRHLGVALALDGQLEAAQEAFERGLRVARHPLLLGGLGMTHALAGRPAAARTVLADLEASTGGAGRAYAMAVVQTALGRRDEALAWLRQSAENRDPFVIWLKVDPCFDALRADPRFDALRREVGLPP